MQRSALRKAVLGAIVGVCAVGMAVPTISPAVAGVTIKIEIGPGYGLAPRPGRVSCEYVGNRLWNKGYRFIRVIDCRGLDYVYDARRDGHKWRIHASSLNGSVKRRVQLR